MKNKKRVIARIFGLTLSTSLMVSNMGLSVLADDFDEVVEGQTTSELADEQFGNFETDQTNPQPSSMSNHDVNNFGYEQGVETFEDSLYINENFELGTNHNPRPSTTTLDGIDISNWQSSIDLDRIDADFVIVKATGGASYIDPMFRQFANRTLSQGRLLGFYHFGNDMKDNPSPEAEATFFYEQTKDYIEKGVPILDFEESQLLHYDGEDSSKGGTGWALRFLETYYTLSGVKPLVYTSIHYARTLDWSKVAEKGYHLWVAQYLENKPQEGYRKTEDTNTDCYGTGAFENYYMHQYTSRGQLEGYNGNLDLNKFYGNANDWQALAQIDPYREMMDMYRLYNPHSGEHFYTSSSQERDNCVVNGWIDEGKGWQAPKEGRNVYRLFNPNSGDHHYTSDTVERDTLVRLGWVYEGIGWKSASNKSQYPVYRLYNPNAQTGTHHYTLQRDEVKALVNMGWIEEGIAWYAYDARANESSLVSEAQQFLVDAAEVIGNVVKADIENKKYENK